MAGNSIPFIDLAAQRRRLGERVEQALGRVLAHGQYIMGPEVGALEKQLAAFCGARHALSCSSGTDALILALLAKGIGRGDAVICPSFTFAATAEAVALLGATPVFADILPDTFNLDPAGLEPALAAAKREGLTPRALIVVDLFGQPADYARLEPLLARHGLWLLADGAQSFGATYRGRRVGAIGLIAATSFFPAKPLGCYGDGGAVFTDDDALADAMRSLRIHGQGTDKYDNVRIGINGRLDTFQAAVLLEKLALFDEEIAARQRIARRYNELLAPVAVVPRLMEGATSVWAQYTLRLKAGTRDAVAARLKEDGVPTAIYYPKPLHQQTAYRHFPVAGGKLPVSEQVAQEVLSLPMHPYLDEATQDRIVAAVKKAVG
jgi:dTDP-4-amino-4,6-dideoxygalactose transaminase